MTETDFDKIDRTYKNLISNLELSKDHYEHLLSRGFSSEEIVALSFRSFPLRRKPIASLVASKEDPSGVPGFYKDPSGEWNLAGSVGLAIPVRNKLGQIVCIKIRADKPKATSLKYTLLSSNPKPDPKSGEVKFPGGTKAHVTVAWPSKWENTKIIRVTEGELKGEIATSFTGITTLSLPGVPAWRMMVKVIEEEKPEKVLLAYDSDKEREESNYSTGEEDGEAEKFDVGVSMASLYRGIQALNIPVEIEDWPEEAGKGIDDVIMDGNINDIRMLPPEEAEALVTRLLQRKLPQGWIYINGVKRFVHPLTLLEIDKEQFSDKYAHQIKGNAASQALSNPGFPKFDLPVYDPRREVIYEEKGVSFFNLYRTSGLEPSEGDVTPFLEHLAFLFPDEAERKVVISFMAFTLQRAGEKILWALLIQGQQGNGKSYLGSLMGWLLGEKNISLPTNEQIHEIYTGWLKSCQLVVVEEVMARGRLELMNKLKPIITQGQVAIREMHKPAYTQPNVTNLMMFTNYEDAIIIDEEDRRYCVLYSPAKPKEIGYYMKLWDWTRGNLPAILYYLRNFDLSDFNHLGHAPMTEGKRKLIESSKHPMQIWMEEAIEDAAWPFMGDLVSTTHLQDCLPPSLRSTSIQMIGRCLKKVGATQLHQITLGTGNTVRVWAVRNKEEWGKADRDKLVTEYERWGMDREPGNNNPLRDAKPI